MQIRRFMVAGLLALACSCNRQERSHLPPEKMQAILFDINLAEAYSMAGQKDSTKRGRERDNDSLALFYRSVFRHHGITQADYEQSLKWYKEHPEDLDSIYSRMIPEMSRLQATYP